MMEMGAAKKERSVSRVNLSSSMTDSFVVKAVITEKEFKKSLDFWQEMELKPTKVTALKATEAADKEEMYTGNYTVQGGTIWTRSVEKYRKIASVHFIGFKRFTYVQVRIDLPGAYNMSGEDIEKTAKIIGQFQEHLERATGTLTKT